MVGFLWLPIANGGGGSTKVVIVGFPCYCVGGGGDG